MRGARLPLAIAALLVCAVAPGPGARRGAALAAGPAALEVSLSLEPAVIRVGDAARLTLTVEHPAGGSVELPPIDQGKAIVVTGLSRSSAPLTAGAGGARERTTVEVALTSFVVGEHRVGVGEVRYTGPGDAPLAVPSPGALLRTRSVLAEPDAPMRAAKGLVRWPAPVGRWAGIAGGLLALAAGILLGARRLRGARPAPPSPAVPPAERALRALAALREAARMRPERAEPLFRDLSSTVRRYLEEAFGLRAPERTTEEFLREAEASGTLAPAHRQLLETLLQRCDLVKFARAQPPSGELVRAIESAERLVRETGRPAEKER